MIDMTAIREAYNRREIDGVSHVPGNKNSADAMTEMVVSVSFLGMMEGKFCTKVTQWITR